MQDLDCGQNQVRSNKHLVMQRRIVAYLKHNDGKNTLANHQHRELSFSMHDSFNVERRGVILRVPSLRYCSNDIYNEEGITKHKEKRDGPQWLLIGDQQDRPNHYNSVG